MGVGGMKLIDHLYKKYMPPYKLLVAYKHPYLQDPYLEMLLRFGALVADPSLPQNPPNPTIEPSASLSVGVWTCSWEGALKHQMLNSNPNHQSKTASTGNLSKSDDNKDCFRAW